VGIEPLGSPLGNVLADGKEDGIKLGSGLGLINGLSLSDPDRATVGTTKLGSVEGNELILG
jgi:hypothetical protein